jgi:hypothetical protein
MQVVEMAQRVSQIALIAVLVVLPITPETSDQGSRGAAQAQTIPCVSAPTCITGERVECERGYCSTPSRQVIVGCIKATCVPVHFNSLPRTIKRQCDRRPACGAGRVAICTNQGDCARTLRGELVNGCLHYSCVRRL